MRSALNRICSGVLFLLLLSQSAQAQNLLNAQTQPKFVNPLPVPSVLDGRSGGTLTIGISQFDQWLGLVNPQTNEKLNTTVWGYHGTYPGPTILARKDVPLNVFWQNNLVDANEQPLPHLLPIDRSIHWALSGEAEWRSLGVPVVTHLHGGHTESASDGLPDQWYTPGFQRKGDGFVKGDADPFRYDNDQEAATIWYHDHALGVTRLNVYAGLAGFYLVTDENETAMQAAGQLPAPPYDLGLAIQDRLFTANGQLYYPAMENNDDENGDDVRMLPEVFGDVILVNGMAWPVLEVEPRPYRFRILNGSDSRFFSLFLSSTQNFVQIGSDQGFLYTPFATTQLLIAPGERKDVILDFSNPALWGQTIILKNNAKAPYPQGATPNPQTSGRVMAFRVTKTLNADYPITVLPSVLRAPITPLQTTLPSRKLILFETIDELGRILPILGTVDEGIKAFMDPVTETPQLNSTEIWEFYNETMDAHPIHLHLVKMQLLNRQKFQAKNIDEKGRPTGIRLLGQPRFPTPDEQGWKDTWIMNPGEVTKVIATFDRPGMYVWHCHILSHEEHDMMRPFFVGNTNADMVKQHAPAAEKKESELQFRVMPNPFSQYVTLEWNLAETATVGIYLYDSKGARVKRIFEGNKDKGLQRISIDGSSLANGIYFCEVRVGAESIWRKLVLQK